MGSLKDGTSKTQNCTQSKIAIVTLCTSPKSICTCVEEMILEHLQEKI